LGIGEDDEVNGLIILIELLLNLSVVNGLGEEYPVDACKRERGL
jgi:hypothetical protein